MSARQTALTLPRFSYSIVAAALMVTILLLRAMSSINATLMHHEPMDHFCEAAASLGSLEASGKNHIM